MGAGLNIACHGGQSYLPQTNDPELAAEIEALAIANGVTFTGGGIWDMSRIWAGVLTAGPVHRHHVAPPPQPHRPGGPAPVARPGVRPSTARRRTSTSGAWTRARCSWPTRRSPSWSLRKLGYTVAGSDATAEPVVYDVPVETRLVPEGHFEAGRVRRACARASRSRPPRASWPRPRSSSACSSPATSSTWSGRCEGTPRNRIRVERLDSAEATAGNLFNRIPDIIAAPPGIVPVTELGPLTLVGGPLADERGVSRPPAAAVGRRAHGARRGRWRASTSSTTRSSSR